MKPEPLSEFQRFAMPPSLPSPPPPKPNMLITPAGLGVGTGSLTAATSAFGLAASFLGGASTLALAGASSRMPPVTCSAQSLPLLSLPFLNFTTSPSLSALPSSIEEAGHS